MANNKGLTKAKNSKKDEFYTQITDIEKELKHYKAHFQGKVVLCNCDDPRVSNFTRYFILNFAALGLKKLIATCYKSQNPDLFSTNDSEKAIYMEYNGTANANGIPNEDEIMYKDLSGDGDFRSSECIEILKSADIVVTNPPFSLFREYIAQLIKYNKQFLIIGNINALSYKEIFPLVANNQVWLGASIHSGDRIFNVPDDYPLNASGCGTDKDGKKFIKVKGVRWFTNMDYKERHEDLILICAYNPEEYPKYFNFDAINIDKTTEIPFDYDGYMGVPITFMDKYNPDQFNIIGLGIANLGLSIGVQPYTPEHRQYRKEVQKRGTVDGDLYMMNGTEVVVPYARIIIKRK